MHHTRCLSAKTGLYWNRLDLAISSALEPALVELLDMSVTRYVPPSRKVIPRQMPGDLRELARILFRYHDACWLPGAFASRQD